MMMLKQLAQTERSDVKSNRNVDVLNINQVYKNLVNIVK